jgi:hypothetical protein
MDVMSDEKLNKFYIESKFSTKLSLNELFWIEFVNKLIEHVALI